MSNPYLIKVRDGVDFRGRGVLVKRLVHPTTLGSKSLAVSVAFHGPGEEVQRHKHDYEEAYFVVQGEGVMTVGDSEEFTITRYDCVYTPADTYHWTKCSGDEPLVLVCAITPPP